MTKIESIMESDEKIVWQGTVSRDILGAMLFVELAATSIVSFFAWLASQALPDEAAFAPFSLLWPLVALGGLAASLLQFFDSYIKRYIITNKRLIISSGIIGTDFHSLYLREIKSVSLDIGLIDKIFRTGTMRFDLGRTNNIYNDGAKKNQRDSDSFIYISSPHEACRIAQEAICGLSSGKNL